MGGVASLEGPVELVNGELILRIPLAAGGEELAPVAKGIGRIQEDELVVVIPKWLAAKLALVEGSIVAIDNRNGKFNLTPVESSEGASDASRPR